MGRVGSRKTDPWTTLVVIKGKCIAVSVGHTCASLPINNALISSLVYNTDNSHGQHSAVRYATDLRWYAFLIDRTSSYGATEIAGLNNDGRLTDRSLPG